MCGFVGEFRFDGNKPDAERVKRARERLAHRGPDEAGFWSGGPVALGFRRLSIIDVAHGQQPMRRGSLVVVYNGEIYNHPEIQAELEAAGVRYDTRSDTESLLRLFERHGTEALSRIEGMFAFAMWDEKKSELVLARDPLGVKPLYYRIDDKGIVFGSELRAVASLSPNLQLDPAGVLDYMAHGFTHSPRTVLDSVMKLAPGHLLRVNAKGLKIERYWEMPTRPSWTGSGPSLSEAVDEVERRLIRSVRGQLLSDVPVGAFLSGGVDSSLIAALMQRAAPGGKVKTFSIGFSDARSGLDESAHARTVARYLGTDHHELILPSDVLARVEELAEGLDEPIADSAILPTYLLSKFARESVKVVLSGEGADEIFAGYNRYKAAFLSEKVDSLPSWGRPLAAAVARRMGKGRTFERLPHADALSWAEANAHSTQDEFKGVLKQDFLLKSEKVDPWEWLKDPEAPHSLNGALAFDLKTVLCDCLLMKVDKTTMRASLEARVPYLDRRLVEYALHLPASTKIRRLKGKFALRRLAAKYLPRPVVWRKKHGFVVPWEEWIRAKGNHLLDDLFAEGSLASWNLFDGKHLRWMLGELRAGSGSVDAGLLFRAVVLGLWLKSMEKERC